MSRPDPTRRRIIHLGGLFAIAAALTACNTLKGTGRAIQKIGEGIEQDVETVEDEVTN